MKQFLNRSGALLLAAALLFTLLPFQWVRAEEEPPAAVQTDGTAAPEKPADGEDPAPETEAPASESPAEPSRPSGSGGSVWDEIIALENEALPANPLEEDYAALIPRVEAVATARADYEPGTALHRDGIFYWITDDGVTHGYSPTLRLQQRGGTGELQSGVLTNALDGKATLMSADDPELMAFTSTGRDVACFSPYLGIKDTCPWDDTIVRRIIELAKYTGGNYYIYQGVEATPERLAEALETCCLVMYEGHAGPGLLSFTRLPSASLQSGGDPYESFDSGPLTEKADANSSGWPIESIVYRMTKDAPNNLFYAGGCATMESDEISKRLHEKGVAVVVGNTREIHHTFAAHSREEFIKGLWNSDMLRKLDWTGSDSMTTEELLTRAESMQPTVKSAYNYMRGRLAFKYGLMARIGGLSWDPTSPRTETEYAARQKDKAFIFISSAEDPYPADGDVQKVQNVTCQWKLPLPNPGELPPIDIAVPVGTSFKQYLGDAESSKLEDLARDDNWSSGKNPWGDGVWISHFAQKYGKTWFFGIQGRSERPGYWECATNVRNSKGEMVPRTVRILVYSKDYYSHTENYTFTVGEEIEIPLYTKGARGGLYDIEKLYGAEPEGLSFFAAPSETWHTTDEPYGKQLWWDDGEAYLRGVVDEPGSWSVTYQTMLCNGAINQDTYNITVKAPENKPELTVEKWTEGFTYHLGTENIHQALNLGGADVLSAELVSGALPKGLDLRFNMTEPPHLTGAIETGVGGNRPGEYAAEYRFITSDYRAIYDTITVRVYGTSPYIDEYTIDLAEGPCTVPLNDWTSYIYETLKLGRENGELDILIHTDGKGYDLDLDKDGSYDVKITGKTVLSFTLLETSSLAGDDYTFSLSAEGIDQMDRNNVEMYARSLAFHLVDHYDLKIGGREVNSRNREDILGDGVFSYDGGNLLTLRGTYYPTKGSAPVISSGVDGLRIRAEQDFVLSSQGAAPCLDLRADTVIEGGAALTLNASGSAPAAVQLSGGACLTARNTDLNVRGTKTAIRGQSAGEGFTAAGSEVRLQGGTAVLSGLTGYGDKYTRNGSFKAEDQCMLADPALASMTDGTLSLDGEPVKEARIESYETAYDLSVAGVKVTNRNRMNVLGDGTVSFDGNRTLYLSGVIAPRRLAYGVRSLIDGLQIVAAPGTEIRSQKTSALSFGENTTITGGPLLVYSSESSGIQAPRGGKTLTISDAELTVQGAAYGITGDGATRLEVNASMVTASGGLAAVGNFAGGLSLIQSRLDDSEGKSFKENYVVNADGTNAAEAVILKDLNYDLLIEGFPVHESNRADPTGDGAFSYDPETNTLTVRKRAASGSSSIIDNSIPDLTVVIAEDVTLDADNSNLTSSSPAVISDVDMTITGPGKLTLVGPQMGNGALQAVYGNLTLKDLDLTVRGPVGAIQGYENRLTLENVTLRASITPPFDPYLPYEPKPAVTGFAEGIVFNGCALDGPAGARVVDGTVVLSDNGVADSVTVGPATDGITVTGSTMTYTISLPDTGKPARLIAAWYNGDGKQLGTKTVSATGAGLMEGTIKGVAAGQAEYRLFALDAEGRPLASALSVKP